MAFSVPIIRSNERVWNIDPNSVSPTEHVVMGRVIGQWLHKDDIPHKILETYDQRRKREKKEEGCKKII